MKKTILFVLLSSVGCTIKPSSEKTNKVAEIILERPALLDSAIIEELNNVTEGNFEIMSACAFHPFIRQISPVRRDFIDRKKISVYAVIRDSSDREIYFNLNFDHKFKCYRIENEKSFPLGVPLRTCDWCE